MVTDRKLTSIYDYITLTLHTTPSTRVTVLTVCAYIHTHTHRSYRVQHKEISPQGLDTLYHRYVYKYRTGVLLSGPVREVRSRPTGEYYVSSLRVETGSGCLDIKGPTDHYRKVSQTGPKGLH